MPQNLRHVEGDEVHFKIHADHDDKHILFLLPKLMFADMLRVSMRPDEVDSRWVMVRLACILEFEQQKRRIKYTDLSAAIVVGPDSLRSAINASET